MAAALFLEMNGWKFNPSEEEAMLQPLALAAGEIDADEFSAWLQASCVAT
jgi:prophage maintenance system killer protein